MSPSSARHLATARLLCSVQIEITFAGVAGVSRPFAPRPTRSAVCSSSMARCYVCHRRRPYKRVRATFDVAHIAGRKNTISVSLGRSILAGGGLSSLPACAPSPLAARNLPPAPTAPAARRMAVCANARPSVRASDSAASYSVAALVARALHAFSLRRAPSLSLPPGFVLPLVALAPPRLPTHARRTGEFPSVERRGWSRSSREGTAFGKMRAFGLFTGCAGSVRFAGL